MSIRRLLADPLPGGAPGLIFDRFLIILGSMFECILDRVYAWCAGFFALFSFACLQLDSGETAVGFGFLG